MKTMTYDKLAELVIEQAGTIYILGYGYNIAETLREIDHTEFREFVLEYASEHKIVIDNSDGSYTLFTGSEE